MHILYVHQNFPAQFGHIAKHLVQKLGWRCTFVSETPAGNVEVTASTLVAFSAPIKKGMPATFNLRCKSIASRKLQTVSISTSSRSSA